MVQISLSVAAIVAIIIESMLYGISIVMLLWTLWALLNHQSGHVNKVMLTVTVVLFILGTFHLIVDARRAYLGFIVSENYFLSSTFNTFKNSIYGVETFVADAVLIYRCHIVWRDFRILIVPIVLWMATVVTAVHTIWSIAQPVSIGQNIFLNQTAHWVASFYIIALVTNVTATTLLAYKIWRINAAANGILSSTPRRHLNPRIRSLLLVIMECGALYSLSLISMLVVYFSKSNGAYIMIDIIGQIIPITFYVIIIRTTLDRLAEKRKSITSGSSSIYFARSVPDNIRVRIEESTVNDVELGSRQNKGGAENITLVNMTPEDEASTTHTRETVKFTL